MTKHSHDADVAFVQALAELLRENDLTELQVKREYAEDDSLDVRVSRAAPAPAAVQYVSAPAAGGAAAPASGPAPTAPEAAAAAVSDNPVDHPGAVTSPMVGTVYLQPEPSAPAFVSIGTQVNEGDTIMIVEAMKTMNHIPAPHAGTVKRILVDDGAAVEYGAPLVIIE